MQDPIQEVMEERARQDERWGEQNHPPGIWLQILGEEVGEANKAVLEWRFGCGAITDYRQEMVQVCAVALAALESFDRQDIPT
jgi:hypothetical protein